MDKSPDAFRTISEVADWLGTPTHVLRFWESRFTQVKPVKRAGGRRYYRPSDMELLGGIKKLLHDDGMTIRGVQKLLREEGIKHVAALSQPLDTGNGGDDAETVDGTSLPDPAKAAAAPMVSDAPQEDPDNVVPLSRTLAETEGARRPARQPESPAAEPPADPAAPLRDGRQRDLLDDMPETVETAIDEPAETQPPEPEAAAADPAPDDAPEAQPDPQAEPPAAAKPAPAQVEVPADPGDDDLPAPDITDVAAMLRQARAAALTDRPAPEALAPLYKRLVALRDRMIAK